MELWIRSQDRECLMKVDRLDYDVSNYKHRIMVNGYQTLVAEYETKKRALEVLDEIQNILMPKCIINSKSMKFSEPYEKNGIVLMDCNADARWEQLNTYVYEMPKE